MHVKIFRIVASDNEVAARRVQKQTLNVSPAFLGHIELFCRLPRIHGPANDALVARGKNKGAVRSGHNQYIPLALPNAVRLPTVLSHDFEKWVFCLLVRVCRPRRLSLIPSCKVGFLLSHQLFAVGLLGVIRVAGERGRQIGELGGPRD